MDVRLDTNSTELSWVRRIVNSRLGTWCRLKPLRHRWRNRRLQPLIRQALTLRARMVENKAGSKEEFGAWLLRSADHVQVWLELTAFDEELAENLDRIHSAIMRSAPRLRR